MSQPLALGTGAWRAQQQRYHPVSRAESEGPEDYIHRPHVDPLSRYATSPRERGYIVHLDKGASLIVMRYTMGVCRHLGRRRRSSVSAADMACTRVHGSGWQAACNRNLPLLSSARARHSSSVIRADFCKPGCQGTILTCFHTLLSFSPAPMPIHLLPFLHALMRCSHPHLLPFAASSLMPCWRRSSTM